MTKFLKINIITIILILSTLSVPAHAETNLFTNKLMEWGYAPSFLDICIASSPETCTINENETLLTNLNVSIENTQYYITTDTKLENTKYEEKALIVLTSYANAANAKIQDLATSYYSIFVICDSETIFDEQISCNSETVTSPQNTYVSLGKDIFDSQIGFAYLTDNTGDIYIIPENLFTVPEYNSKLNEYFVSNLIANTAPDPIYDPITINKTFYELALYLSLGLACLLFAQLIIQNSNNYKLKFSTQSLFEQIQKTLKNYQSFTLNALLVAMIFFTSVPLAIIISNRGDINTTQIRNTINYIDSLPAIQRALNGNNISTVILIFSVNLVILLVLSLFLPSLHRILTTTFLKAKNINIRLSAYKYFVPTLLLMALIALLFINSYILVMSLLIICTAFLIKARISRIYLPSQFSYREKVILMLIPIFLLTVWTWTAKSNSATPAIVYENLFSTERKIVKLPYSKDYSPNVRFNAHHFRPESNIFAGDYLVYSPFATNIYNRDLEEFAGGTNYVLIDDPIESPEYYLNNDQLRNEVITETPTPAVYVSDNNKITSMTINFACTTETYDREIRINLTSDINTENVALFEFPLCKKTNNIYTIPVFNHYYSPAVITLELPSSLIVKDFALFDGTSEASYNYLRVFRAYTNYVDPTVNQIYSYGSRIEEFDISNNPDGLFNISAIINRLLDRNLLSNPFDIWSNRNNSLIKNEYQ